MRTLLLLLFNGGVPHSVFTVRGWKALGFVDGLELANLQPEL